MVVRCASGRRLGCAAPSALRLPQEPRLLLSDPVALEHVLHKRAYAYPKVRIAARMLSSIMGHGLIVAEGEAHKRQKAAIQPGFSMRSVQNLSPIFGIHATALCKLMRSRADDDEALLDVHALASSAMLDALGEAAFGLHFDALSCAQTVHDGSAYSTHPLPAAFEKTLRIATHTTLFSNILDGFMMLFPVLEHLPVGVNSRAFRRSANVLHSAAAEVVRQTKEELEREDYEDVEERISATLNSGRCTRRSRNRERPDLLASLLRANVSTSKTHKGSVLDRGTLSDAELVAQLSTFIFAGHETTATQLTWLLLMLAQNPDKQDKLRGAIHAKRRSLGLHAVPCLNCHEEDADPRDRNLELEEFNDIEYLDWCMRETLRLHGSSASRTRVQTNRKFTQLRASRRSAT